MIRFTPGVFDAHREAFWGNRELTAPAFKND